MQCSEANQSWGGGKPQADSPFGREEWKRANASARPRIPLRASALKAVSKFGFLLFIIRMRNEGLCTDRIDLKISSGEHKYRGATGAAHAPKLDKTPMKVARRRCRRRLLSFKIEVRTRSCRSYPIWHPWSTYIPVRIIAQVQWFIYQNQLQPSSGI